MELKWKKLICWFLGHNWNLAAHHYGDEYCDRCHFCQPVYARSPFTLGGWVYWRWQYLYNRWRIVKFKIRCWWISRKSDDVPF